MAKYNSLKFIFKSKTPQLSIDLPHVPALFGLMNHFKDASMVKVTANNKVFEVYRDKHNNYIYREYAKN